MILRLSDGHGLRHRHAAQGQAALLRKSLHVAERLPGDVSGSKPGGYRRGAARRFTDIAGLADFVASLDALLRAGLLNGYPAVMTDAVFAQEGTMAKIVGHSGCG